MGTNGNLIPRFHEMEINTSSGGNRSYEREWDSWDSVHGTERQRDVYHKLIPVDLYAVFHAFICCHQTNLAAKFS